MEQELKAMKRMAQLLEPFDYPARRRILEWVQDHSMRSVKAKEFEKELAFQKQFIGQAVPEMASGIGRIS